MTLKLLSNVDINTLGLDAGYYYCDDTCTGLPPGISAGRLIVSRYDTDPGQPGNILEFVKQEFEGLLNYGDRTLSKYERFGFPKEEIVGHKAFESKWFRLEPSSYRLAQPQTSKPGGRP